MKACEGLLLTLGCLLGDHWVSPFRSGSPQAGPEPVCGDPPLVPWLNGRYKASAVFHKSKLIKLKGLHVYEVVSFLLL